MSISSEINRISQNVSDSLTAVASKGATVPSGANSDDLPNLIASLPSTHSVTYNLTGGASASVTPAKAIAGQGFSLKLTAPTGYALSGVTVTMGGTDITSQVFTPDEAGGGGGCGGANLQTKSVSYTPTTSAQSAQVTADSGYDGLEQVNVSVGAIPSQYIVPSGTKSITENGTGIDVTQYASVDVAVPTSGGKKYKSGTYTPSATYNTTANRAICTIADIGFTPNHFILAIADKTTQTGTTGAVLRTSFDNFASGEGVMRTTTRYSNTSGTLGATSNASSWTTQTNTFLYLSGGTIYFRTTSSYLLTQNITYNWYAYE